MSEVVGTVLTVASSANHAFSKTLRDEILLIEGLGVDGDAHCGKSVKHRSRVRIDASQPNLRQVHLIAAELLEEMVGLGFDIVPGDLGENILVRGIDLINLARGTRLKFASSAEVEVTGLRNPCRQIEDFRPGLLRHMIGRADDGKPILRTGVMGVVLRGGPVRKGDRVEVLEPSGPAMPLERV